MARYHTAEWIFNEFKGTAHVLSFDSKKARLAYIASLRNDNTWCAQNITYREAKKLLSKGRRHFFVLWDEKNPSYFNFCL
jgi:hypothetical protein